MNFTREPLVETIITPREGYRLLLRNSKGAGEEDLFLDAIEVITMGNGSFYRSLDRPKAFIVPVGDYEIYEVKEAKMALKLGMQEHATKPREGGMKQKEEGERRKDRRSRNRRRREKEEVKEEALVEEAEEHLPPPLQEREELVTPPPSPVEETKERAPRVLIPPPTTLISETISRYKETPVYAGAFFTKEEIEAEELEEEEEEPVNLREQEEFGLTDKREEEEEEE